MKFTTDEWESLRVLPFAMFVFLGNGSDAGEVGSFLRRLATTHGDPLQRELVVDIVDSGGGALLVEAMTETKAGLTRAKEVLAAKLTKVEYHRFLTSLISSVVSPTEAETEGRDTVQLMKATTDLVSFFEVDLDAGLDSLK